MENLASKYRPKDFNDISEQTVVTEILEKLCQQEELTMRNFLFIGPAGTGKTTSARALANKLNDNKGEIIELDAASHSGVDSIRTIIDQARQYPIGCKYKIFIIDECHALSNAAWSALLKTLEEQPARTIMALCTTNPEKIPPTILSRVQVFQLTKISLKGIEDRLKYIVDSEIKEGRDIKYDDEVINYIAKLSGGGMRDAITNLEQCLTYSTDLSVKVVMDALNLPNYDDYFNLLNGVAKKDNQTVIRIINDVYNSGVNFVKWFEGFHGFICNIVKYIFLQDISATMIPSHYLEKISKYGPNHSALCLRLANKLVDMNQELKTTQYLQELAITYLCDSSNPKKENK